MVIDQQVYNAGRRDSSGMRLTYTPTLRADDASVLLTGDVGGIIVPPEAENFKYTAYCHSSCTEQVCWLNIFIHKCNLGYPRHVNFG